MGIPVCCFSGCVGKAAAVWSLSPAPTCCSVATPTPLKGIEPGSCCPKGHDLQGEPAGVPSVKAECHTEAVAHCNASVAGLSDWPPSGGELDL